MNRSLILALALSLPALAGVLAVAAFSYVVVTDSPLMVPGNAVEVRAFHTPTATPEPTSTAEPTATPTPRPAISQREAMALVGRKALCLVDTNKGPELIEFRPESATYSRADKYWRVKAIGQSSALSAETFFKDKEGYWLVIEATRGVVPENGIAQLAEELCTRKGMKP